MEELEFELRLKETIAWCTRDPSMPQSSKYVISHPELWSNPTKLPKLYKSADYLRSSALRPSFYKGATTLFLTDGPEATIEIESIAKKRKQLLTDSNILVKNLDNLARGRLLAHMLGYSLHDGLSAYISKFFDDEDSPPWDTWLFCVQNKFVLSWVPQAWVEDVEAAICYQASCALSWVDELISCPEKFDLSIPNWLKRYADFKEV